MKLIIFPNLLSDDQDIGYLPEVVFSKIKKIDGLIAENKKRARAYLKNFIKGEKIRNFLIKELNEHTQKKEIFNLIEDIKGKTWGLISDVGMPCIADPGAKLISLCYENDIEIEAILGPSSIFLALILSGFNAQEFCFNGYLPREEFLLKKRLKHLEKDSKKGITQIFIETPYRSKKVFDIMLRVLNGDTDIFLGIELGSKDQKNIFGKVSFLKNKKIDLLKKRVVFLIR